jgi:hypothetical protein
MTTQSIVCGSCSAAVPYGRLSCPECGELLASVAGSRRVRAGAVTTGAKAVSLAHDASTNGAAVAEAVARVAPAATVAEPAVLAEPAPAVTEPEAQESAVEAWDADLAAPAAEPEPAIAPTREPEPEPEFAPVAELDGDDETDDDAHADQPPWFTDAAPVRRPEPSVLMSVAPAADGGPERWTPSYAPAAAPGAYVPPPPIPAILAGAPAPARTWAGHTEAPAAGTTAAAAAEADATRVDEFVRWLAVAGSTLAAVGFLLPMASTVIGSTGGGYLDRWGLAGPFHLVLVVGLLAILALALAADRIPLWIRVGLPGLGLGALLIGLVWPYLLIGALDAGPGTFAILVGALMLGVAGVVALVTGRHESGDRAV